MRFSSGESVHQRCNVGRHPTPVCQFFQLGITLLVVRLNHECLASAPLTRQQDNHCPMQVGISVLCYRKS